MAYFCMKCSQLFVSKDAAACLQCNPQWGGEDSLVGFLSDIIGTENPNLNRSADSSPTHQLEFEYEPLRRTGT